MADAAAEVRECRRLLAKTAHNLVGEVLRGDGTFTEWNHYPTGDVYDPESHAQYYYHAHPRDSRPFEEHGHFHLFLRARGMPARVRAVVGGDLPPSDAGALTHLVAISMDRFGEPVRLFTTNRWVTGGTWYRAGDVVRMLDLFAVEVVRPNLVVNRWMTAMVRLFRPEIEMLLVERDRTIDAWGRDHREADALEDRRLDVTSMLEISVETQITRVLSGGAGEAAPWRNRRTETMSPSCARPSPMSPCT